METLNQLFRFTSTLLGDSAGFLTVLPLVIAMYVFIGLPFRNDKYGGRFFAFSIMGLCPAILYFILGEQANVEWKNNIWTWIPWGWIALIWIFSLADSISEDKKKKEAEDAEMRKSEASNIVKKLQAKK